MTDPGNVPDDILEFYEHIGHARGNEDSEQARKDTAYDRPAGLSEDQLAKLGDDMLQLTREPSADPNDH